MNLGEIKRFVNDGLQPLNKLIGNFSDDETINSVFGLQKKILTGLDIIKTKTDTLPTIASNVSSILSKVNNLGSQKKYSLSRIEYSVGSNQYVSFSGAGLVVILNPNNSGFDGYIGVQPMKIPPYSVIPIPIGSSSDFHFLGSGYLVSVIWCPLS